jgi:hypothetical protein
MALHIITPSKIIAGDTAEWLISLADYPASIWTLTYTLVKDGVQITFSGSQYSSTETHHINNSASATEGWIDGLYSYRATVSDGADRYTVEDGTIEILPNFATAAIGYDDRSFAKKALDAVEAVLLGRASQAQLEYSIAGRQLKFIPPAELMDLRDRYRSEYRAEEAKKLEIRTGKSRFGSVQVRFS